MKLIIFTKYSERGPSSRYRHYQYLSFYEKYYNTKIFSLFPNSYNYNLHNFQIIFKLFISVLERIIQVLFVLKKNDVVIIEYELIPYFPSILEKYLKQRKIKYILDYDDAIFHNYDKSENKLVKLLYKNKISNISSNANLIITGSPYLTKYFSYYNANVVEIPTSINFDEYFTKIKKSNQPTINIGWLGSSTTSKNLISLNKVFYNLKLKYKEKINFIFCGFDTNLSNHFINTEIEYLNWTLDNQFNFLNKIDIGIMPLEVNDFNKGKCGFKLIQYMAFGIPTISYPFEANLKINHNNGNLFACDEADWFYNLSKMIDNIDSFKVIGVENINIVKKYYNINVNYLKYFNLINSL